MNKDPEVLQIERVFFGGRDCPFKCQEAYGNHVNKYRAEMPETCEALILNTFFDDSLNSKVTLGSQYTVEALPWDLQY